MYGTAHQEYRQNFIITLNVVQYTKNTYSCVPSYLKLIWYCTSTIIIKKRVGL